ncbi:protein MARD1-like [Zingiber officinale]|uniref:FLZ-type domain-containing protein n=1 Tax=Zingiber officinale TaxID=94328 RepID=A0A8J5M147_ZINOF|nr:protein MARD1-like [Zingiber officinale]KAG6529279.1 hypothetical protein ZIOFF_011476 [Zingiber officinale]
MANQLHPATSGDRSWSADAHLHSLKPRRNLDPCCGVVGLAIVAALDNTAGAESTPPPTTIVSAVTSSRTSNLYSGGTSTAASVCSGEFPAESPAAMIGGAFEGFQVAEFLSRCNLCKKWLHGKDIYMYRGEKGFCSTECRYKQMIIDEKQEIYGSQTIKKLTEMPRSPFAAGENFFPGLALLCLTAFALH